MSDWDDDYYPNIGSPGGLHDLDDKHKEPRLWFAKSTSRAASIALAKKHDPRIPIGFHKPPAPQPQTIERGIKIPLIPVRGKFKYK
jgi:hypothetical protein